MARAALLACCAGLVLSCAVLAQPALAPEYDCLIEARQALDIRSPVEGVIEAVHVQRGAPVKKGQTLAMLFSGPERAVLDLARSRAGNEGEIKAAEARVELTRKKFERAEELVKKNFVSANARDEAEAEYRLAAEQLRVAQENRRLNELEVKRAEEILAQREIRSPVTGVVVEVLLRPGELTSSNQKDPIVKPMQIDPLCEISPTLPASRFGSCSAWMYTRLGTCGLITPMQFGPHRAIDASRQIAAIASCRARPSAPASVNPPSKITAAPTPRSAASCMCSRTRV